MDRKVDAKLIKFNRVGQKKVSIRSRPLRIENLTKFLGVIIKGSFYHVSDDLKVFSGQAPWPKSNTSFFTYGDGINFYNTFFENEITTSIRALINGAEKQVNLDLMTTINMVSETIRVNNKIKNDLLFDFIRLGLIRAGLSVYLDKNSFSSGTIRRAKENFQAIEALELDKNKSMLSFLSQSLFQIDRHFLLYPFIYFLYPFGKGKFLSLTEKLDRSTSIGNVINQINSNEKIDEFLNVQSFNKQAYASIIFHKCIFEEYNLIQPQPDRLDYLFSEYEDGRSLYEKAIIEFPNSNLPSRINSNLALKIGLLRLTKDAVLNIRAWPTSFKNKVWKLTAELPRSLKITKERLFLDDENYPADVKKLSIFCLSGLDLTPSERQRIQALHLLGIRNVGNLILLSPAYKIF